MKTSIVLIAYKGDRWIPDCVATLADAAADRQHLILLDNVGNTVLDQLDLGAFDAEVLRAPHPMGFAEANNFALMRARRLEEAVLFLNQDTLSVPGWIDECLSVFRNGPNVGAVSPLIANYGDEGWDPSFLACLPGKALPPEDGRAFFLNGIAPAPALLVHREVLAQAGPFDPIFGSYYEDYDLCRRIGRLGYDVAFARRARIRHYSGSTTDTPARERRRQRLVLRNRIIYELRHGDRPRAAALLGKLLGDLPRRFARGLAGTPSSQPPPVVLQAYRDLARLAPRLLSGRRDRQAWEAYLREIGWADRFAAPITMAP